MTEPISNEGLALLRGMLARLPKSERLDARMLLARLDVAEARVHDMAIALREVGQDRNRLAAEARAVPDGTRVEECHVCDGSGIYLNPAGAFNETLACEFCYGAGHYLLPADTEEKP